MLQRRAIPWPWQRPKLSNGIDLGGGHFVAAEDLLEGHFRRMASPVAAPAQATSSHDVRIQVSADTNAAIRVIAPTLAPLTQVAEELAATLTSVRPTPQFRADLQRALEAELRRRLEDKVAPDATRPMWVWLAAGLISTLGLASILLWLLSRRD